MTVEELIQYLTSLPSDMRTARVVTLRTHDEEFSATAGCAVAVVTEDDLILTCDDGMKIGEKFVYVFE